MIRVINNKRYNTETAEFICDYNFRNLHTNDFNYYYKAVYITKKGNFFMIVEQYYSKELIPLNREEAQEFIALHGDDEDAQKYFGDNDPQVKDA